MAAVDSGRRLAVVPRAVAIAIALFAFGTGPVARGAASPVPVEVVQTSAALAQALTRLPDTELRSGPPAPGLPTITVNDRVRFQHVEGFGAALTDSSAWLLERRLSSAQRAAILEDLFGPQGLHLNFLRVPMGASDFTRNGRPYTYDDLPPGRTDPSLSHFSVAHDRAYILPALRQILALDPRTEIFASPWSLPAWMKTNHSLNNLNYLGSIIRSDYRLVAGYFVKFIRAYRRFGVPVAAVTLQNEPGNPTLYPGTELDAAQEGELLDNWVAPALHSAGLHAAIYGGDLSWASPSVAFTRAVASGPASPLLAGIAWHCYYGDPLPMSALHQLVPRLDQIVNECSPGITPYPVPELVISAMRNWASVVALWNLALNQHHGPVQVPNHGCPGCFGAVTINDTTGTFATTTAYSGLGQASEFVQRGAQRIASNHFVTYRYLGPGTTIAPPGLDDVAFLNPNGRHVLLAYNGGHTTIEFAVRWSGESFSYALPARSTVTFMWPAES